MFKKLKEMLAGAQAENNASRDANIYAPVAGECVAITEVNDPTFSQEILGKGVAIRPSGGRVVAPVDGRVEMMFETGHAVSILSSAGAEILVHVGLDTVNLKGKYFTIRAKNGDTVKKGDVLVEFDGGAIAADGYDTITPVVVCNPADFSVLEPLVGKTVAEGDLIFRLEK